MEPARRPGRPKTGRPVKQTYSVRLSGVYPRAKAKAEARGETITDVLERLLGAYLAEGVEGE